MKTRHYEPADPRDPYSRKRLVIDLPPIEERERARKRIGELYLASKRGWYGKQLSGLP